MREEIIVSLTQGEAKTILYTLIYYVENSTYITEETYKKIADISSKFRGIL